MNPSRNVLKALAAASALGLVSILCIAWQGGCEQKTAAPPQSAGPSRLSWHPQSNGVNPPYIVRDEQTGTEFLVVSSYYGLAITQIDPNKRVPQP